MASIPGNRHRYRGRVRSNIRSAIRHLQNILGQSQVAAAKCGALPMGVVPSTVTPPTLVTDATAGALTTAVFILNLMLTQKMSDGPTCADVSS